MGTFCKTQHESKNPTRCEPNSLDLHPYLPKPKKGMRHAPWMRVEMLEKGEERQQAHRRGVAEPPNLMPHRSACLLLDTKHSRENTKLLGSVGHTPGENLKIHIFAIRITNERIKLTSFVTISYITFNTTSEYNNY